MTKKVYIIHGWGGNPDERVLVWFGQELEKRGYEVMRPAMPDSERPIIKRWINKLNEVTDLPDKNSYFIGHSIGCQAIMRYFEGLPSDIKVGGALFIAGWFNLAGLEEEGGESVEIARPWIKIPIDFKKVKAVCPKITVFLSSNEPYGYIKENKKIFEEKLNARVRVLKDKGHFSEDTGVIELPEALDEFIKMN